jgi:hypothetical protein
MSFASGVPSPARRWRQHFPHSILFHAFGREHALGLFLQALYLPFLLRKDTPKSIALNR